ncbi:MAG: hypothetical protein AAFP82_03305 [Bacteroidota bacterium]
METIYVVPPFFQPKADKSYDGVTFNQKGHGRRKRPPPIEVSK